MMQRKTDFSNLFAKAVFGLLILVIPRLAMAADDASVVGGETSSNRQAENFQKGDEINWVFDKLFGVQLSGWAPRLLGAQFTGIYQYTPAFTSPYEGSKSLTYDNGLGRQLTQTYGVYFGSQLTHYLQAYLDVEMFRGSGISDGLGLGGYTNGDVIRAGPANLG